MAKVGVGAILPGVMVEVRAGVWVTNEVFQQGAFQLAQQAVLGVEQASVVVQQVFLVAIPGFFPYYSASPP